MSVVTTVTLPAQPTVGASVWVPLGGDGVTAPLGYFDVDSRVVGDASGGTAQIAIHFDPRYTSLLAWANISVLADTAPGDFAMQLLPSLTTAGLIIVGTLPGVEEAFTSSNSAYLWYPPPIFHAGNGVCRVFFPNVDATETYSMAVQVFVYNRDVRNRMNMTWLHQLIPSTNAPVAS